MRATVPAFRGLFRLPAHKSTHSKHYLRINIVAILIHHFSDLCYTLHRRISDTAKHIGRSNPTFAESLPGFKLKDRSNKSFACNAIHFLIPHLPLPAGCLKTNGLQNWGFFWIFQPCTFGGVPGKRNKRFSAISPELWKLVKCVQFWSGSVAPERYSHCSTLERLPWGKFFVVAFILLSIEKEKLVTLRPVAARADDHLLGVSCMIFFLRNGFPKSP